MQVKLNIVSCPPVTTVLIKRPDLKYQLGFSVQNGIVSMAVYENLEHLKHHFLLVHLNLIVLHSSDLQSDARRDRRERRGEGWSSYH